MDRASQVPGGGRTWGFLSWPPLDKVSLCTAGNMSLAPPAASGQGSGDQAPPGGLRKGVRENRAPWAYAGPCWSLLPADPWDDLSLSLGGGA